MKKNSNKKVMPRFVQLFCVQFFVLCFALSFVSCAEQKTPETQPIDSIAYNFQKWRNAKVGIEAVYKTLSSEAESNPEFVGITSDSLRSLVHAEVKSKGFASMEEFMKLETEIFSNNKYDSILLANNIRVIN